jgi:hypothetical protein
MAGHFWPLRLTNYHPTTTSTSPCFPQLCKI